MTKKELIAYVKQNREEINSISRDFNSLNKLVLELRFVIANPPKFKYGDNVIHETNAGDKTITRKYKILKERVSNWCYGNTAGSFYRIYECAGEFGIDELFENDLKPEEVKSN